MNEQTAHSIHDVARLTGLSGWTLRYYASEWRWPPDSPSWPCSLP
jgi:hypothetical protein